MSRATARAREHAVEVLRTLGRELVAGSWSRDAEPISEAAAVVVIVQALGDVYDAGVSVIRTKLASMLLR